MTSLIPHPMTLSHRMNKTNIYGTSRKSFKRVWEKIKNKNQYENKNFIYCSDDCM